MRSPLRTEPQTEVLTAELSERLLARASELDAVSSIGVSLPALRAAATEAGISEGAFEAALAELRHSEHSNARKRHSRRHALVAAFMVAASVVGALAVIVLSRTAVRSDTGLSMITQTQQVRCISPEQLSQLLRPILSLPANEVTISPPAADGMVLKMYGTEEQLRQAKVALRRNAAEAEACPALAPAPARQ